MVKLFSVQSLGGSSSDVTSSSTLVIDVDLESDLLRLAKGVFISGNLPYEIHM